MCERVASTGTTHPQAVEQEGNAGPCGGGGRGQRSRHKVHPSATRSMTADGSLGQELRRLKTKLLPKKRWKTTVYPQNFRKVIFITLRACGPRPANRGCRYPALSTEKVIIRIPDNAG